MLFLVARQPPSPFVMAGLVPAIHGLPPRDAARKKQDVDGRDKPGNDGGRLTGAAMPCEPEARVEYQLDADPVGGAKICREPRSPWRLPPLC